MATSTTRKTTPTTTTTATAKTKAKPTQLELLKTQAEIMGVEYREDITEQALRKQLMDALAQADSGETISHADRKKLIKDSMKLERVVISPNATHMKEHQGQLFSVGNSILGYVSKFVLFNAEYHVPKIILDHIKNQKMQYFASKVVNGEQLRESKLRPMYTVEVLDPLSKEELEDLAKSQAARQSIS